MILVIIFSIIMVVQQVVQYSIQFNTTFFFYPRRSFDFGHVKTERKQTYLQTCTNRGAVFGYAKQCE